MRDKAPLGFKTCTICKQVKKLDEFVYRTVTKKTQEYYRGKIEYHTISQPTNRCKACHSERARLAYWKKKNERS